MGYRELSRQLQLPPKDPPGSGHLRQGTPTVDPTPAKAAGIVRTKRLHRFDRPEEDRNKTGQKKRKNVTASQLPDAKIYPWYVEKHQLNEFSRQPHCRIVLSRTWPPIRSWS